MSTSKCKLRPNEYGWVAGTSTNKAGATPVATGVVVATATRAMAAATTAAPAVGTAEIVGVPTPMTAAATNKHERV